MGIFNERGALTDDGNRLVSKFEESIQEILESPQVIQLNESGAECLECVLKSIVGEALSRHRSERLNLTSGCKKQTSSETKIVSRTFWSPDEFQKFSQFLLPR